MTLEFEDRTSCPLSNQWRLTWGDDGEEEGGPRKGEDEEPDGDGLCHLSQCTSLCSSLRMVFENNFEFIKKRTTKYILYFCLLFEAVSLCSAG